MAHPMDLRTSPNQRTLLRIAKIFSFTLGIVLSGKTLRKIFEVKDRDSKGQDRDQRIVDITSLKIAAFPALLPMLYKYLRRLSKDKPATPELLAAPSLLLLPASWRKHVVLYTSSSALLQSARKSGWNRHAPPLWTLYIIGNMWLLWTFVFNSDAFPKAYTRVVISNSTRYVPPGMTNRQISDILTKPSSNVRGEDQDVGHHHNPQCATLHPDEPSCLKNCIRACAFESARIGRWMGVFVALSLIVTRGRRARLKAAPSKVFLEWLVSSTRGTAFVAGSITSAWALNCASQRSTITNGFPHAKWLGIGSLASLWILALPRRRRDEIAFYVARLAVLSAWDSWRLRGGGYIPYGECILFALSWARLDSLKKDGEEITGVVGMAMRAVENA